MSEIWQVWIQLAPWMLLGTLVAGLLHILLPPGFARLRLRGPAGVFKAVGIGVPLPLCSCGVIPAGIGLKNDGASNGAAISFLISTPQTGVDSAFVSASFLGWPFAFFKLLVAAVTGVIGGLVVESVERPDPSRPGASQTIADPVRDNRLKAMVSHGSEIIRSIWVWLVIGVLVSALINVFVPPGSLDTIANRGPVVSGLVVLAISLPLYVCATGSVPIAAALVNAGLPASAALVFLMAGPATNVGTVGAIYKRFGGRVFAVYLGTIVIGSMGFGYAFDWLIHVSSSADHMHHPGHGRWWEHTSGVLLAAVVGWFAVEDLRGWLHHHSSQPATEGSRRVPVHGMKCQQCANRLEKALRNDVEIQEARVNLSDEQAIIAGPISDTRLRELIESEGFQSN